MFERLLVFVLFQLVAGGLGWFLASGENALTRTLLAVIAGSYCWYLLDSVRAFRFLRWLQQGDGAASTLRFGIWGEIADRMHRLLRLRQRMADDSEARLQDFLAAMQASPNGVVLLDQDGRIEWFNQTAGRHFGFDAQRDLLQHVGNLVRDPGFAAYFAARGFDHELEMPGRDSTAGRPVRLSVHLHPYGAGRHLLLSRDITLLQQAETMRRDFVANVSHEIRTPLTVLSGFIETLQSLPLDDDDRRRYLALMAQQSQRMETLVKDLLMLSRLEGSPPPPADEWAGVDDLIQQCRQDVHDLSTVMGARAMEVQFDIEAGCEIAGSRSELFSAMSNLIGNAVRYTPGDREIKVSWHTLAQGAGVFCVKDAGIGIAPEHLSRITERFYRVDRSRSRDTGGTGLGLAIVKHVAQRHDSELQIESTPGRGSAFCLVFAPQRVRKTTARPSGH